MSQTTATTPAAGSEGPHVRTLKIIVVGMGILIVLGVFTVIGRIVYLASQGPRQAVVSGGTKLSSVARLAIPAGAAIRQISLSGDRLAVHFEGPANSGIAIVDLASGAVLSRVDVVPELPR